MGRCVAVPKAGCCSLRLLWQVRNGDPPVGMRVVRACSTPGCVEHLRLVSGAEVVRLRSAKRDEISDADVREMRRAWAAGEASYSELALRYQRSRDSVRFIVTRRRRKSVA